VLDFKSIALQRTIKSEASIDSVVHSDGWRRHNSLVNFSYNKHFEVPHSKSAFGRVNSYINGIELFWGYGRNRETEKQRNKLLKTYRNIKM
jgi:hypothetical protein